MLVHLARVLYLLDRGCLEFARLFAIHHARPSSRPAPSNSIFKWRYSHPVDRASTSVLCDQSGVLPVFYPTEEFKVSPHE
ncbi:hypothetical protein B2J89_06935 [Acidovorax sp. SRB_24]|nr:hypothetical protein [Acidovorax sp. SRB_24]